MSRILDRSEFIPLLQEVSNKLDAAGIRNEIPFVYKSKENYESIKILIPQDTDATILEDIFKSNEYVLNKRIIDFYYKDFRFIFVRTVDSEFFQTFFYYSWDIVPTLMNAMLNKMGLDLQPNGLKYIAIENPIMVSNNIKHIIEYLGLSFEEYISGAVTTRLEQLDIKTEKGEIVKAQGMKIGGGFKTLFDEVSFITTSPYFNVKIFKEYQLSRDFFYFERKPQYDYALSLFDKFDNIEFQGYEYDKKLDSYLLNIDSLFPGSNFLENVTKAKFGK